ncbi:TetR/AcrR family transcriptional regulator [Corallococcus silvisoli]|uniref:TetR/AcrR family transcriptional regulator n=1 Tax=Corallococcus silvisoli TaxID=2697031 RepID=UPI001F2BBCFA|nr:TetR/AcrR family transcriptional regulator [Corallococcus silvisoli]
MAERVKGGARERVRGSAKKEEEAPVASERTPRERMVYAAASLLSERGLAGTSFSEVIERSGAPRGSIYHHFPDGKDALTAEALTLVGERVLLALRAGEGGTPAQVVQRFFEAWRKVLLKTDCQAGCAIAAVANERLAHPELGARAAAVFISWERELEARLVAAGLASAKAGSAAALILASVEGALILCRARRDIAPFDAIRDALVAFVGP